MFLGIDAGGTKTVCVLVDEKGRLLGYGQADSANYQAVGLKKATEAIVSAVREALTCAETNARPRFAVLGLAGVGRPLDRDRFEEALRDLPLFRGIEFLVTSDAHIALVGAVGQEYGVVLIAGTGAIAFGINHAGEQARADGWGHLLGDEGSGYWIGLEALRAVLRAYDGRGPSTILGHHLFQRLGVAQPEDLVEWAYHDKPSVDVIAALSSVVFAAAAKGDRVARAILHQAGTALGRAAASVIRQLDLADKTFPFVTTGGLFKDESSELLLGTVRRVVRSIAPHVQWRTPWFSPEIGAVIIGLSRWGLLSEGILENLAQGMKRLRGGIYGKTG